jgi:histidyl-tRNA synthetase
MRRYDVALVWRQAAGVGNPSSFLQADLDIVGQGGSLAEQALADAEVLKVRSHSVSALIDKLKPLTPNLMSNQP